MVAVLLILYPLPCSVSLPSTTCLKHNSTSNIHLQISRVRLYLTNSKVCIRITDSPVFRSHCITMSVLMVHVALAIRTDLARYVHVPLAMRTDIVIHENLGTCTYHENRPRTCTYHENLVLAIYVYERSTFMVRSWF